MPAIQSVTPQALTDIEDRFRSAWTGAKSTPFIVDAPISAALRAEAEEIVRRLSLSVLLHRCPTLAVWAILTPLAQNYGASTNEVYLHIARFVKGTFNNNSDRDTLKRGYRTAARKIGLPVSGNEPTDLFFAPLGPPLSRHADLATAFISAALSLGTPAIEDTPSARQWQRRAVRDRCPNLTRLHKTIDFDMSAHCARRFEAWRKGSDALNAGEVALFEAYDRAARNFGRKRTDLTGPPQIYWTGDRLALEAEPSSRPQRIKTGPFPVQIASGARHSVNAPWPAMLSWSCGSASRDVPFGPADEQLLVFEAESGSLLARVEATEGEIHVAASRLVVLSRGDFDSSSFGPAMPAADADCRVAWVETGDTLSFPDRADLKIITPRETAIWIDATAIGRAGRRTLMGGDGALVIQLDPEIGGHTRIARAQLGPLVKYTTLKLTADGAARIPFADFGFPSDAAPCKAVFEVLAPGAAGDFEARAELSVSTWLWPNVTRPDGVLLHLPLPANFNAARSAGLRAEGDQIKVDLSADVDAPILGLDIDSETHEFIIRTGAEVLHHYRLANQDKVIVPRGARIVLGHDGRHETMILQSSDRDADLLVLGRKFRRPFFARSPFEITAEHLEASDVIDNRVALRRKDGRIEIFARIEHRDDPVEMNLRETKEKLVLDILPQQRCDAVRVRVETILEPVREGDYSFARHLIELSPIPGIAVSPDLETGRLFIEIDRASFPKPGRLSLWARRSDVPGFQPIEDGHGYPVAVGLGAPLCDPDQRALGALASLAAEPVAQQLDDQNARTIGAAYKDAIERIGERRLVGSIRPALAAGSATGGTPRHDLVGTAAWIFEASSLAYQGLPETSGLAALSRLGSIGTADGIPDPEGDTPLAGWLARIASDDGLPEGLSAPTLVSALAALRFRLKESDLRLLLSEGRFGVTCACLCDVWIEDIKALRTFDSGGGGDVRLARIVAAIERFARACALGRSSTHLDDLAFRTGLTRAEVGECLTLMLRAGIEIFVYFRALWSQAAHNKKGA